MTKILAALDRRNDPPADLVVATGQLVRLDGNARPYFSLTGETYEGRHAAESRMTSGGAIGETLTQVWPDLAPLNALHLADDRGEPMYAAANGYYWLGFTRWVAWDSTEDEYGRPRDCRAIVAAHFRISLDEADQLHDMLAEFDDDEARRARLDEWVAAQSGRWDGEARAVLRDVFGVETRVLNPEGVTVWCGPAGEAFAAMLNIQSCSVLMATTEQGWTVDYIGEAAP